MANNESTADKAQLRRQWLKQRQMMLSDIWQQLSERICLNICASDWFCEAQTVLLYSSYRQEPDLTALLQTPGKSWGYPRCVDKQLVWHRFRPEQDVLESGAFGILEPNELNPKIDPARVDVILVPSVGLDYLGYRLGYGGGFYDRLLSDPKWQHCRTIGICFDDMLVEQLPHDDWDQSLRAVCTEKSLHYVL